MFVVFVFVCSQMNCAICNKDVSFVIDMLL